MSSHAIYCLEQVDIVENASDMSKIGGVMDHKSLKEGWGKVLAFIDERTKVMPRGAKADYLNFIAFYIGVHRKSVDRWIEAGLPSTIMNDAQSVARIAKLYEFVALAENGDKYLASALGGALELKSSDFGALENYRGSFALFRRGKDGFIKGDLEISNSSLDPWMHFHRAVQDGVEYKHRGPVYHVNGRIYMVGIGVSNKDKYFRPMIFRTTDKPHSSVTFGIVLTERSSNYNPLSAKVALVSKEDSRIDDKDFLDELWSRLIIDSDTNVIYGDSPPL